MADNETILAVGLEEFGDPDVLHPVRIPQPHAAAGHVRVRVRAAAINPTDLFFRNGVTRGALNTLTAPYIPGMDFAGVIDEVGDGSTWQVGDAVAGVTLPSTGNGAYSSRVVVPAESVTRIPRDVSFAAASTLPMNGLTAQQALDRLELPAGATIGVTGGAGAFGGYVIQLAKISGLRVVADAKPEDEPLMRALGADVIVRRGPGLAERLLAATPDGLDGVADGALLGPELLPALKASAPFAAIRGTNWEPVRGIVVHHILIGQYVKEQHKLDRLRQYVEQGRLTLRVADTVTPEQASEAHRRLEKGGVRGRLVIAFPEV